MSIILKNLHRAAQRSHGDTRRFLLEFFSANLSLQSPCISVSSFFSSGRSKYRIALLACLLIGLVLPSANLASAAGPSSAIYQSESGRTVYVLTFEGAVTPVLKEYIVDSIAAAQESGAELIILELDTPGGSVDITKSITQAMIASSVPIVVYVAPPGAHAGSAGTFITLAGHAAAMAPGSSIGAASPISSGGEDIGDTLEAKIKNILSADIENLAERRGEEATEWAIAAVQDAEAATANQALELGVIDFIASDIPDLLEQLDGFEVVANGESITLETGNVFVERTPLNRIQQILNFLADPSIASLLFSLGTLGLIIEVRSPGFGVPGILGAICLLLAFYALGQLDANVSGLALIVLAIALFVAELFTPTFGVLAAGGVIAFIFGGALLFDTPGVRIPWAVLITLALLMGAFTFFVGGKGLAAQRRQPMTGGEGMLGQIGTVKFDSARQSNDSLYSIFVYGEWWKAKAKEGDLDEGDEVVVVDRDGYTLVVERAGSVT